MCVLLLYAIIIISFDSFLNQDIKLANVYPVVVIFPHHMSAAQSISADYIASTCSQGSADYSQYT